MPPWVAEYVGIPYRLGGDTREGADCWGLVRLVLREVFGRSVPEYPREGMGKGGLARLVAEALPLAPVDRVEAAGLGDIVLLRIMGAPCHVGLAVGDGYMIHTLGAHDSALERFAGHRWAPRIEGFYRVR